MMPPEAIKAQVLSGRWIRAQLAPIIHMIEAKAPVSYGSYRDGEWRAITGLGGANCDGTELTLELGDALSESLVHADGLAAAFWPSDDVGADTRDQALSWLQGRELGVTWFADCPIRRASEVGLLAPFCRALRRHPTVALVGGPHLGYQAAAGAIGRHRFVEVSPTESWREVDRVVEGLQAPGRRGAQVVLFAAGMGSNLMIHRARPLLPGAALIDVGSVLDPYAGVYSRRYMRSESWKDEIKPKNLPTTELLT